jgi:hypothetical protein
MSWTQVYVSGWPMQEDTSVESIEEKLKFILHSDTWAGEGSTILKQTRNGSSYCFLSFLSFDGALAFVDILREFSGQNECSVGRLKAEISQPKAKGSKGKKSISAGAADNVRLRRKRAPPIRKHPVKKSSAPPKK